jgi:tRNA pseudouridine38-40 synthase
MHRYFIVFSYNGGSYHGWQRQINALSVQEVLESKLSLHLHEKVEVVGAGRTDTGVHAKMMCAHFDFHNEIKDLDKLVYKLNTTLGKAIVVSEIKKVNYDAHARFDATLRTYQYHLIQEKSPFLEGLAYYHFKELDFNKMNKAAELLLGEKDFSCFSKSKTQTYTNDCNIKEAYWEKRNEKWVFTISANRFLRNMVRSIVGTLIDIGENKIEIEDIQTIIESKSRKEAGKSVPAHGLYLVDIKYPKELFI